MHRSLIGAAVAALLSIAPARAQVDVDAFVKRDSFGTVKISPTGEFFAATVPLEDRTVLVVIRRSDKQVTARIGGLKDSVVDGFWWASPTRVVMSTAERFGAKDEPYATGRLYAVNADGSRSAVLAGPDGAQVFSDAAAFLIDPLRSDDRNVLVALWPWRADAFTSVEKLDIHTGDRSPVAAAPVRRAQFTADAGGAIRFADGAGKDSLRKLYHRAHNAADWQLVNDEAVSQVVEEALGFSADGRTAYLQRESATGPDAIVALDTATGQRRELLRDAVVDPAGILYAPGEEVPVGATFIHDRARNRFFDEASPTARLYRKLEAAFPGEAVHVTSSTADGKLVVVQVWSDRNPGDFYLFDTATRAAGPLLSRRIWLDPATLPATRAITLKARDGLDLHGYLTEPNAPAGTPRPLVLLPHGGPFGIADDWGFDGEAAMLAQAGYAVLRVNFRGSGGYGRAHQRAGARQWGRAMQDDLTDATRWAIAQKIADPARICIVGASYGAYAALMGAAREPALYACAVGYVGLYDLVERHKQLAGVGGSTGTWVDDWMGERDGLAAFSPTTMAAAIRAPVFLAAGGRDQVTPIEHSRKMEKALERAGVPVETLYYPTEGHGFYTEEHQRAYYVKLLEFLSRHLGGAKAKS